MDPLSLSPELLKNLVIDLISEVKRKSWMTAEILKDMGEKTIKELRELFNQILRNKTVPIDFKKGRLVIIPKKSNADKCENYRTINLLLYSSKILTRIIPSRLDQFEFRQQRDTREAIMMLRLIIEKHLESNERIFCSLS